MTFAFVGFLLHSKDIIFVFTLVISVRFFFVIAVELKTGDAFAWCEYAELTETLDSFEMNEETFLINKLIDR